MLGIARRNRFIPRLPALVGLPASHPTGSYRGTARWSPLGYHSEGKKKKKKAGPQLKPSEYTDCGDPFHLIIAPFELFNTNAEWLVVASGGGVSGISEGRWGENITVQIKPWVLNFKDEMHYSWLITPGSDCMSTNCKWRGIDKCTTNTTHLKCKYFY